MIRTAILFTFALQTIYAQQLLKDFKLPKIINETSGLEIWENQFLTHNDSGDGPNIYFLNRSGELLQTKFISSAKNTDWEDLAMDASFVYIADIGNNFDTRKDLSIYKVPTKSFDSLEVISFSYPEQRDFNFKMNSVYDAEALVSIKDHLLIFTKNRAKKITELYIVPKTPGNYEAKKIGSLDLGVIVTGADYNEKINLLALTATVDFGEYYILTIKNFSLQNLKKQKITKTKIPIGKTQVEAIKIVSRKKFWITTEDESLNGLPRLMLVKL